MSAKVFTATLQKFNKPFLFPSLQNRLTIVLELTVSVSGAIKVPEGRVTGRLDTVEMVLILFILCLWAFVIRIFLNKWGESMSGLLAKSKYFMPGGYYVLSFIIVFFPVLQNQL